MKDNNVYKMGPWTHNIIHTFSGDGRYSDFIKPFNDIGLYVEIDNKGKSMVIEMPREDRKPISFKNLLKCKEFKNTKYKLPVIMGVNVFGNPIVKDLDKMPHLFVGGSCGTGKTMLLKNIYESLSAKLSNDECKFVIIDTKAFDFVKYSKKKNMLMPVITDIEEIMTFFDKIAEIIDCRINILRNKHSKESKNMPKIIIMIDEIIDLLFKYKKETEKFVQLIGLHGRSVGVYLIMATQRGNHITSTIYANTPTKICFKVRSKTDSRVNLGEEGAELLLSPGDMLYSEAGRIPERIHVALPEKHI
ncbi:MAG: AAA family ATPase [Alphaproteobacteria bacterium]|nr:AAA family ATPase [Alphaproteobacteria bacterium]